MKSICSRSLVICMALLLAVSFVPGKVKADETEELPYFSTVRGNGYYETTVGTVENAILYTVTVSNVPDSRGKKVSSAKISVNGIIILSPSDFNQKVTGDFDVGLLPQDFGEGYLSVDIRGNKKKENNRSQLEIVITATIPVVVEDPEEPEPGVTYYEDEDHDDYGNPNSIWPLSTPAPYPGWVTNGDDCNDSADYMNPGIPDSCPETP